MQPPAHAGPKSLVVATAAQVRYGGLGCAYYSAKVVAVHARGAARGDGADSGNGGNEAATRRRATA